METVNQEVATEEKMFTQAEVDAIVGDRLKRDRAKYADYDAVKEKAARFDEMEEANKSELQKATERATALQTELDSIKKQNELRDMRDLVAAETGLPAVLLTADTEEKCREQAAAIINYSNQGKTGYPTVRDAGEAQSDFKGTPKQQFAEWANEVFK